jgi:hypothetical protein
LFDFGGGQRLELDVKNCKPENERIAIEKHAAAYTWILKRFHHKMRIRI